MIKFLNDIENLKQRINFESEKTLQKDFLKIKTNFEQQIKINKTISKRNKKKQKLNKNIKHTGIQTFNPLSKNISIQTINPLYKNISIQTNKEKINIPKIKEKINIPKIKEKINIPKIKEKVDEIKKYGDKYYFEQSVIDYFKKLNFKKNKIRNEILYLNVGNYSYKRNMIALLSSKYSNMQLSGIFGNSIFIDFYGEKDILFQIFYIFNSQKDNVLGICSKEINKKQSFYIPLKQSYNISLSKKNKQMHISINNEKFVTFVLKNKIKYILSNSNFNIKID